MADLSSKRYYSERTGAIDLKIDFETFKALFFEIFLEYENYIAINHFNNIDVYVYGKTKMVGIWPIRHNIQSYDPITLFTVIELLYDHIYVYITGSAYPRYKKDAELEETIIKKREFRANINIILKNYNEGYELSEDGEIQKLSSPGFETLMGEVVETNDPENIDSRVKYAISKFSRYNSSIKEKKDAVRTLADVLEYLNKFGTKLDNKDDSDLFGIINRFDIRHHNREQQSGYDKDVWYDWMFYTFLASINVLLKLNVEKFDSKIASTT